ncbi:unnamed protein product [Rotaria sp. Silwood2]|nr:unnamed protein product [Rotaria sp. Silwood2]
MMPINNSFDDDGKIIFQESEVSISRPIRFWLLLLLDIPSIICSCFLLFHLFTNKTLRYQLKNHVIIVLLFIGLIIELLDIPLHLSFLHLGNVHPSIPFICLIWWFMDIGLYNGCTIIMAWCSVHLYLLVFHDGMFLNRNRRLFFHYLPIIMLLFYILVFYIIAIIFPPCKNTYDYTLPVCNDFPCYLGDSYLGIWDSVVNSILPTCVISISTIVLFINIHYYKRRAHQPIRWRKQRKMILQLLLLCTLYLLPNIPLNILIFSHICGLSESIGVKAQLHFDFLCYFVILLYPFLCLGFLSKIRKKVLMIRNITTPLFILPNQSILLPNHTELKTAIFSNQLHSSDHIKYVYKMKLY